MASLTLCQWLRWDARGTSIAWLLLLHLAVTSSGRGSTETAAKTGSPKEEVLPSLLWMAPILSGGGYSSEALSYALALEKEYKKNPGFTSIGLRQFAEQENRDFTNGLPKSTFDVLSRLFSAGQKSEWDVVVCHATPDTWHADGAFGWGRVQPCPPRGARFRIGRTMYETDRLPSAWVKRIASMDEVWVPTNFAAAQFAASGVPPSKLVVVPEAVDTHHFDPTRHKPLSLDLQGGKSDMFRFLAVFKWERRKGWDVLLRAFFEEFSEEDPVILYIKTSAFHSDSEFEAKIRAFTAELGDAARKPLARHAVIGEQLPLKKLPRLYRSVDSFVLPSRGEGWGRPHVEAMSMGLPVIATNWSGPTEFLSENCSLPLRIDGLETGPSEGLPEGHQWAQPSVQHLRELMRWAVTHREEAAKLGVRAREAMVERYSPRVIALNHLVPELQRIARRLQTKGKSHAWSSDEL